MHKCPTIELGLTVEMGLVTTGVIAFSYDWIVELVLKSLIMVPY